MTGLDAEFLAELRAMFAVEADEHLREITAGLLELEKEPDAPVARSVVETVFRAAHSLKGAARAVDLRAIESHCESLEETFGAWRRAGSVPRPEQIDGLHRTVDAVNAALAGGAAAAAPADAARPAAAPARTEPPPVPPLVPPPPLEPAQRTATQVTPLPAPAPPTAARAPQAPAAPWLASVGQHPPTAAAGEATVRIAVAKLDARLVKAEEMLGLKLSTGQRAADLQTLREHFDACMKSCSDAEVGCRALRQSGERDGTAPAGPVQRLLDAVEQQARQLRSLHEEVAMLARAAVRDQHAVAQSVDELLADTRALLRLPISSATATLPKLVRDLCRDQGKRAELQIRGDELDLDKRILEGLKDPLIHLLRNAVDHGVEVPEARLAAGKPAQATLTVVFSQRAGERLELLVADDGAGIDAAAVRRAAVEKAQRSADEVDALGDAEAIALVFESALSTRAVASHISGRGLGLAIVREKAEKLGGSVTVESRPGEGTRFRLVVPSVLATFRGVLVEAEGRRFVLPTASVACVVRVGADEVRTVEGRETLSLGNRAVAHVRLADVLALPARAAVHAADRADAAAPGGHRPVVVLGEGDQRIAFAVDALIGEQEVLVKRFSKPLVRLRHVAAATVLGSGEVAPILDVADLMKSARQAGAVRERAVAAPETERGRSVLVAEDSITSRMLIRNVLEAAGYRVTTAVDGLDAYARLRAEAFDLVVSDVEMPRLDGYGLTRKIRADRRLSALPVVLLSALEAPADRERGADAGADAYLGKSGFDQANLLDTVRRLI